MIGPDGAEYPSNGVFQEILPIEKIVTSDEFSEGWESAHPEVDLPKGLVITCLFDDLGQRTKLTLITSHPTVEDREKNEAMGVVDGWNTTLDKLEEFLRAAQA